MSVSHVLLGVLHDGPAHGYDLKREHDVRFPGAKALAYGQVYSTLARLEREGLVEVAETGQDGGPERTTYALTEQGRATLADWLRTPEPAGPYVAEELVRKTVTSLRLHLDAGPFLRAQRATHLDRMRELTAAQRQTVGVDERIALDHVISHIDADLRWLDNAARRVDEERKALS